MDETRRGIPNNGSAKKKPLSHFETFKIQKKVIFNHHATHRRLLEDAGIPHSQPSSRAMTVASTSPHGSRFAQSTRVAISHLGPPSDAQSPRHIIAVVALVWPYSSSTRALSLLLAEPDIRLRKGKGQVKVTFHGPSAEAVAKGQVGIGDTVKLGLEGVQWVQTDENVSTPGKKIEWDLVFDGRADLDVKRDSQVVATINVDCPTQAPATLDPSWTQPLETAMASGPTQYLNNVNTWSSPIFVKGQRLSSGLFFDASLDLFADDDGFVVGKGRKRTKFARQSDSWRLLDRTPSPGKEPVDLPLDDINGSNETALHPQLLSPNHDIEAVDVRPTGGASFALMVNAACTTIANIQPPLQPPESQRVERIPQAPDAAENPPSPPPVAGPMQPPATPSRGARPVPGVVIASSVQKEVQSPARSDLETPRLGPLPSPGLPLVSPLIRRPGLSSSYFPASSERRSELDASGDQQQLLPALEGRFASSNEPAPAPDIKQSRLLSPLEPEELRAAEPEVAIQDALFELSPAHRQLSPQLDQLVQPMSWSSFHEEVQQTNLFPPEQEQEPVNAEAFDFEFLNTSPMDTNTEGQNRWHFPDVSLGTVTTPVASKDVISLESMEASNLPADLPRVITHAMPQYDDRSASVPHDSSKSDTSSPHGGVLIQDESVSATSEIVLNSSSRAPIDPSLITSREAAAHFVPSSKEDTHIPVGSPEQVRDPHPWSDKLDISAVDAESQRIYIAPPFPFQQHWHHRSSSQRIRHSSQHPSLDGVSDEVSGDESSEVEDMPKRSHRDERSGRDEASNDGLEFGKDARESNLALSSIPFDESRSQSTHIPGKDIDSSDIQAPNVSQSVIVLDSSDDDATSNAELKSAVQAAIADSALGPPEDAVDLDTSQDDDIRTERRRSLDEIQELQGDRIQDPALPPLSAHGEPAGRAIDTTTATDSERTQTEMLQTTHQDLSGEPFEPSKDFANFTRPLEERPAQTLSHQLVTPENTQEGRGDRQQQHHTVEVRRETFLPATPQNTQEYADLPQSAVELPIPADAEIEAYHKSKMPVPTSADKMRERRRSPRLSRKFPPQDMTEVASPYFAPRRTSYMRDRAQLASSLKPPVVEPGPVAANDTIQTTDKERGRRLNALPDGEATPGSPLLGLPKAGLTTSLSYYPPLSLLQDHFSQSVDIFALSTTASTEPERAKLGPRDWYTTLHFTDPSLQGKNTVTAQIFRPYKIALPKVQRGNLVLLRNFKVQSRRRKCMLLSTESSAWTIFSVRKEKGGEVSDIDAVIVGPPVEYGAEEKSYVLELKKWWEAEGEDQHPVQKQASQTNKAAPVTSDGDGGVVNHEVRDSKAYQDHKEGDEQSGVSKSYHELRDGTLYRDDAPSKAPNSDGKSGETNGQSSDAVLLHELRDGTVYRDNTPSRAPRSRQRSSHDGTRIAATNEDVQTRQDTTSRNDIQDVNRELESVDIDVKAETDSGEESPTNEAVSSQIYHELRNGRRYADPAPGQTHAEELQQQEGEDEDASVIHELRDGVTYTDE